MIVKICKSDFHQVGILEAVEVEYHEHKGNAIIHCMHNKFMVSNMTKDEYNNILENFYNTGVFDFTGYRTGVIQGFNGR